MKIPRSIFVEETTLIVSVFKWFVLAVAIGIIVGASTAFFLICLDHGTRLVHSASGLYFVFLPLAFLASVYLVKIFAPDAAGHGTEKVIEAVHKKFGKIKFAVVPVKLVTTVITVAFGGSVGKEGPCAQIGAGLASRFARLGKFDLSDHKKLVICGISAGFATVFGTPVAGAIFGVEVLFLGRIMYDVLLPSFVAGIIGYQVSSGLGVLYFSHPLKTVITFSEGLFFKVLLAGIFFGLVAVLFIQFIKIAVLIYKKTTSSLIMRPLMGGIVLVLLVPFLGRDYLGLGLDRIEEILNGAVVTPLSFVWKSIFTSITLSSGGSGGVVYEIYLQSIIYFLDNYFNFDMICVKVSSH